MPGGCGQRRVGDFVWITFREWRFTSQGNKEKQKNQWDGYNAAHQTGGEATESMQWKVQGFKQWSGD